MKSFYITTLAAIFTSTTSVHAATLFDLSSPDTDDLFNDGTVSEWSRNAPGPTAFDTEFPAVRISTADLDGSSSNNDFPGPLGENFSSHQDTMLTGSLTAKGRMSGNALSMNFAHLENTEDRLTTLESASIHLADDTFINLANDPYKTIAALLSAANLDENERWDFSTGCGGGETTGSGTTLSSNTRYLLFVSFLDDSVRLPRGPVVQDKAESNAKTLSTDDITAIPESIGPLFIGLVTLGLLRRRRC